MPVLIIAALFLALDVAAMRWGFDSRPGFPHHHR
jgi:hypothetical protein